MCLSDKATVQVVDKLIENFETMFGKKPETLEIVGTCRACRKPCAREEDGLSWCCGAEIIRER